jgi:hypothetical protein
MRGRTCAVRFASSLLAASTGADCHCCSFMQEPIYWVSWRCFDLRDGRDARRRNYPPNGQSAKILSRGPAVVPLRRPFEPAARIVQTDSHFIFPSDNFSAAKATSNRHPSATGGCILRPRGGDMLQQSSHTGARNLEWSCDAISPTAEPCDSAATSHCGICGRWFCAVHAEDETWHICAVEPGEEGGEG